MEIGGYAGKILNVDLTTGNIQINELSIELIDKFLGGYGVNCRLAYEFIKPGIQPFSRENAIIIGAGPILGTNSPVSSKTMFMTKMPVNGAIVNGSTGGNFGVMLKLAGYDHIIITGASKKPVYLKIFNEDVEICGASNIWGKDIYEATDMLKDKFKNSSVYAIGPAGEKMVKTTVGLVDKLSSCGKGGLPAVMGFKKLKAIVVYGTKKVKILNPKRLKKLSSSLVERIKSNPDHERLVELGTMAGFDTWFKVQGTLCQNWSTRYPVDRAYRIYGPDIYLKNIKKERFSDPGCPVPCKDFMQVKEGEFAGLSTYCSSFYGRLENFASRNNIGSFNQVVKCLDYCNRMGLCIHSATALIDWAVDLYKHGIITRKDTSGLKLEWDYKTTIALLKQMAHREGFGAALSEGYNAMIARLGKQAEKLAIHVKNTEPLYDPRLNRLNTFDFHQITSPRGAHPAPGTSTAYMKRNQPVKVFKAWAERMAIPEEAIRRIFASANKFNVARLTKWAEEQWAISNSLGLGCLRGRIDNFFDMRAYAEIYAAVTGIEITPGKLRLCGERIWNILKMLNFREGFTRKNDKWPDRWLEPLKIGKEKRYLENYFGSKLTREDCERMLDDYYDERGWNIKLGIPTKQKLIELNLAEIAGDLENKKIFGTNNPP